MLRVLDKAGFQPLIVSHFFLIVAPTVSGGFLALVALERTACNAMLTKLIVFFQNVICRKSLASGDRGYFSLIKLFLQQLK